MQVKDHLKKHFHTISKDASFKDAIEAMVENKTNGLVVMNSKGRVVGTVDSFNLIQRMTPAYLTDDPTLAVLASDESFQEAVTQVLDAPVSEMMEKVGGAYVRESDSMILATTLASKHNARYIPVFADDSDELIGLVTRTDIKRATAKLLGLEDSNT